MLKKLSAVAATIVAFTFIIVSIAHACSGLASMNLGVQHSPMNMGGGNPPCSKEKGDICQAVRDSILSVKPSISNADTLQQTVTPLQRSVASPAAPVSSPGYSLVEFAFHPVFKLPLTVSYQVLRI